MNVYMLVQNEKRCAVGMTWQGPGVWQFRSTLPGQPGEFAKLVFPRWGDDERIERISVREGFLRAYLEIYERTESSGVGGIEYGRFDDRKG